MQWVRPLQLFREYLSRFASVTYGLIYPDFSSAFRSSSCLFSIWLSYLFVEVAPVAASDDELVDLELRMKALCPVKQISVERVFCGKPDAG